MRRSLRVHCHSHAGCTRITMSAGGKKFTYAHEGTLHLATIVHLRASLVSAEKKKNHVGYFLNSPSTLTHVSPTRYLEVFMVVCLEESVLLGYIITSKGYFKMSETNYPVTVSHALQEQSSDVSTNLGLYVHNTQAMSPYAG